MVNGHRRAAKRRSLRTYSQITLKLTGQTRGKFIIETDNKVVQVAKTLQTLYNKYSSTRLNTKQNNEIDCYGSTPEAERSTAAEPELSTTSGEIYEAQDQTGDDWNVKTKSKS